MTGIELVTRIRAPIETCFRWSLSIDLELQAAKAHHIRAVGGRTSGFIGAGERVRWKTRQFGVVVTHESEITGYRAPEFFEDAMVTGMFRSFRHAHYFRELSGGETEMRDDLKFSLPFWMLGTASERLLVRPRLTDMLKERNRIIKEKAETAAE